MDPFTVNFEKKQDFTTATTQSTKLGRAPTTIATALEYHIRQSRTDPFPEIIKAVTKKYNYYGQKFENVNEAFTLPKNEITHSLIVGSTGVAKTVLLCCRAAQSIVEKRGVIIIDPKNDTFAPQVMLETLKKMGRPASDFKMVYFPNKWGYKAITERDSYLEISKKLISLFGFTPSENPGVDHYRSLGRTLLRRLLKMFFVDFSLGVSIKKDFLDIQKHIILLKQDLEKEKLYERELGKTKPNCELLEKYSKRFYTPEVMEKLYFADSDIATLDTLANKFQEISEGVNFENDVDIADALYNSAVIYIRVDMLDTAALQWTKYLIVDIIQNTLKKRANTDVYCDEASLYTENVLSLALAVVRNLGLEFSLFLQALSQFSDEIRSAVMECSNYKLFYKSSDPMTLAYLEKVGGIEAITTISAKDGSQNYSQDFEPFLNATKMRALPRTFVGVVVAEFLPYPQLIQTNFIGVEKEFDWSCYQNYGFEKVDILKIEADKNISDNKKDRKSKLDRYRVYLKESKLLLENSDLMGITLGYEEII